MGKGIIHGWVWMQPHAGIPCGAPPEMPHVHDWGVVTCAECLACKRRLDQAAEYRRRYVLQVNT